MRSSMLLALAVLLSAPPTARGAVLIEMVLGAEPMRVVIDRPQQRVVIAKRGGRTWSRDWC